MTLKLYIKGTWKEIIIDDYLPCFAINRHPIFANTKKWQLGWYIIQKGIFLMFTNPVFCKVKGRYFYWKDNKKKKASNYLQMLTGYPSKVIIFSNMIYNQIINLDSSNINEKEI